MLTYIIPFIILILVVVFIHEYGHYYFAKKFGVGVTDFSIGFGKELFGFNDKSGTRWKFCAIPLGGYVKFFGDRNVFSQAEQEKLLKEYDEKERIEKAKLQLKNIASAKLVITSRIHTALPAVAFGTPVLFLSDGLEHPNQKSRLDGMEQFFPIINSKDLREWETKFPTPFKTHLPFVKNIEKQIKDFLKE